MRRCRGSGLLVAVIAWGACAQGISSPPGDGEAPAADAAAADAPGARDLRSDTAAPADTALAADAPVSAPDAPPADAALAADTAAPGCAACTAWGAAEQTGKVQGAGLDALSGIAASWRNPGVLYVHNDHARPEFFALAEDGKLLGSYTLDGAPARDLEDIGVGRCPQGTCVFLADIGGNLGARPDFAIFRAAEPAVAPGQAAARASLPFERIAFTYPDGAHNAESLLIDPGSGALYLVTKVAAGARSTVYRLATQETTRTNAAVKVAELPVPMAGDQPATAGSAHPCGAGFLLRTNNALYEFRIAPGAPFETAFAAPPVSVPVGAELQGEGVSYGPDGRSYYTTSEGSAPPLHRVRCK